ncbi:nucleotidyltransferase substrate binding protein [Marinobacterium sp. MBR-109]|jgi:hypothetical protein|uniref:nucleotidyltransferase substrate binding protein n=1 Tax=Marinobacterium sp. MBR-109 TaxID=3156462 RepID=UPI0033930A77
MTDTPLAYTLDLSPLRDAIQSLEDGIEVVSDISWFNQQNHKVRNTLIAGVIQNFEFVYEICVKMLRRQLELEAAALTRSITPAFVTCSATAAKEGY